VRGFYRTPAYLSEERGGGVILARSDGEGPLRLKVGQSAVRTKTITDADLHAFAQLTGDWNPLHFDDAFAAATRFGRRVAQGGIAAGMLNALVAMDLPGPGTVFMSQTLTYHAPAYVGDTLTARAEVVSLKPDKPVCQLRFEVTNQDGKRLLDAEAWTYTLRPDSEK
jgi:acyl dehydratase